MKPQLEELERRDCASTGVIHGLATGTWLPVAGHFETAGSLGILGVGTFREHGMFSADQSIGFMKFPMASTTRFIEFVQTAPNVYTLDAVIGGREFTGTGHLTISGNTFRFTF